MTHANKNIRFAIIITLAIIALFASTNVFNTVNAVIADNGHALDLGSNDFNTDDNGHALDLGSNDFNTDDNGHALDLGSNDFDLDDNGHALDLG